MENKKPFEKNRKILEWIKTLKIRKILEALPESQSVSDNEQTQKVCQCKIKSYYKVGEIKICAICKGVIIDKPSG